MNFGIYGAFRRGFRQAVNIVHRLEPKQTRLKRVVRGLCEKYHQCVDEWERAGYSIQMRQQVSRAWRDLHAFVYDNRHNGNLRTIREEIARWPIIAQHPKIRRLLTTRRV